MPERIVSSRSRTLFAAALAIPCLVILIPAILAYSAERHLHESFGWVSHTLEVERGVERLRTTILDAETGQRGFLLTGREPYLGPYRAAIANLPRETATVRTFTADNPAQQENMRQLDLLMAARLDLIGRSVAFQQRGKHAEALAIVNTDRGKETMDAIRALLHRMAEEEQRLLAIREQRLGWQARASSALLFGLVALNALFAGTVFYFYRRISRLQQMVTMCAWSRTVEYKGEWLSFEEYMLRRFGLDTTHSISPGEAEKVMAFTTDVPEERGTPRG